MVSLFLRSSSARLLAPLGATLSLAALFLETGWLGGWGDTVVRATTNLIFLLPFLTVAGVIDAHRIFRENSLPSVRISTRVVPAVLQTAVSPLVWGLASYCLILLAAGAVTARISTVLPRPELVAWFLAGCAALAAHSAAGVLLGRLPLLVGIGFGAAGSLIGNALLASRQGSVPALFTIMDDAFLGGATMPRFLVQSTQAAFFVAVAFAAVFAAAYFVRPGIISLGIAVVCLVAATAIGSQLAALGGAKRVTATVAAGPTNSNVSF